MSKKKLWQSISIVVATLILSFSAQSEEIYTQNFDEFDDGEIEFALGHFFDPEFHIVPQIIEAEFVVCPIGNVAGVGLLTVFVFQPVNDASDGQAQEFVNFTHPLRIASGEVVIYRDDMNTVTGQGVQVNRQGGDKGFPFAGSHFRNAALM